MLMLATRVPSVPVHSLLGLQMGSPTYTSYKTAPSSPRKLSRSHGAEPMNCVGCALHPPTATATAVVVSPILMHRYLASFGANIDTAARNTRLKPRDRQRRPNRPGHYTSLLASSFTVGGTLSAYPWGRFADRFGRKPVMIVGLCSTALFSFTFGMSTTFASAIASRWGALLRRLFSLLRRRHDRDSSGKR